MGSWSAVFLDTSAEGISDENPAREPRGQTVKIGSIFVVVHIAGNGMFDYGATSGLARWIGKVTN